MQRILIIVGILILVTGLLWPYISKLPIGRLPGDIIINKPGFKIYIPIATMILISAVISFILYLFRK
ncbi:MAG: hypothetical protein CMF23_07155 [Ignavibacteriae bacterium]|nr:hypothetical protein [Ignavibacteriota bacterium]|tara:strand:+ start:169 stop:369 length:201 start_codon:yes stop_codon:yes gene_type:complete